jgi:hypothetical protein
MVEQPLRSTADADKQIFALRILPDKQELFLAVS